MTIVKRHVTHILRDIEALSRTVAERFVELANTCLRASGRFRVAMSGGNTPRGMYTLLATAPLRDQVPWHQIDFFWGDERTVPPDHPDSNYRMTSESLLSKVAVDPARVHRMRAEQADLDAAAWEYQRTIAASFEMPAEGAPPSLDLVLLGMGGDGHTASLFPRTAALSEQARWVVPNHVPKLNTSRLTMTVPLLNRAARIFFLVAGADKDQRLVEVLCGPLDTENLPSQLIQPANGVVEWFLDQSAGQRLPKDP